VAAEDRTLKQWFGWETVVFACLFNNKSFSGKLIPEKLLLHPACAPPDGSIS
jgi:hypothetical protein